MSFKYIFIYLLFGLVGLKIHFQHGILLEEQQVEQVNFVRVPAPLFVP